MTTTAARSGKPASESPSHVGTRAGGVVFGRSKEWAMIAKDESAERRAFDTVLQSREQRLRFLAFCQSRPNDGCWEWSGSKTSARDGYGQVWLDGKLRLAHRISWRLWRGLIPPGALVLHRCDNPGCVNPEHLFVGTHSDNMLDAAKKGRIGNVKLTPADVQTIRQKTRAGTPSPVLAEAFGVSAGHIRHVARGRWWTHVQG